MTQPQRDFIYEHLARDLAQAIRSGVYGIHERMPSLRRIVQHYNISLATAIAAFAQLEEQGLIHARPRSGYFVSDWPQQRPIVPEITRPPTRATTVTVGEMALALIQEGKSPKLTRLGAAVPDKSLLPLPSLSRSLAGVARRKWQQAGAYENPAGVIELRRQIARLLRHSGVNVTPDEILITNGCLEALTLSLRVVSKPGDTIAIESPTYFGVLQVMELLGLKALEIATHPNDGIDLNALAQAIQHKSIRACILMPNFNNPLGSRMPEANKQRVVDMLARAQIPLIEDDVYGALSYQQPRPKAAKAYDQSGHVLLCSSFSKTIAPAYRVGWIVPGKYLAKVEYYKFLDNISTASLPQYALAEFLARGGYQRAINKNVRIYRTRMEQLKYLISQYFPKETRLSNPQGGFILWAELPDDIDCMKLYRRAMEKHLAISPGVLFCAHGQYRHHIRLSCGAVEGEKMREAIKLLGKLIGDMRA